MSKSVYVVNNMEQEGNVLKALIESGYKHPHTEKYKYSFVPSINGSAFDGFPYEIIADKEERNIYWQTIPKQMENVSQLNKPDELIVYDGREENDKMKISKEVYDALVEWKNTVIRHSDSRVFIDDIKSLPGVVIDWIYMEYNDPDENGDYSYLRLGIQSTSVPNIQVDQFKLEDATRFETREEASKFMITGMGIVEV